METLNYGCVSRIINNFFVFHQLYLGKYNFGISYTISIGLENYKARTTIAKEDKLSITQADPCKLSIISMYGSDYSATSKITTYCMDSG